jgi:hypothetical protein
MFLHQVANFKTKGDTIFWKWDVPLTKLGTVFEIWGFDGTFLLSKVRIG